MTLNRKQSKQRIIIRTELWDTTTFISQEDEEEATNEGVSKNVGGKQEENYLLEIN